MTQTSDVLAWVKAHATVKMEARGALELLRMLESAPEVQAQPPLHKMVQMQAASLARALEGTP